jgi:pimeloyl-ACP methyl ester carboxylesterase
VQWAAKRSSGILVVDVRQPVPIGHDQGASRAISRGRTPTMNTEFKRGGQMSDMTGDHPTPTVVLVHGAFADSSSWSAVIERLQAGGVPVIAAVNPLRGLAHDSSYVRSVLEQIAGPVVAVGHSYGGAVISNAATDLDNVVGLVFVAAFAPDKDERLGDVSATSVDSVLSSVLVPHSYPSANGVPDVEFTIDPAGLHDAFAADLPPAQAAVMAVTQRPVSELAFSETSGTPAWRNLPSWSVVATADKAAGTDIVRSMAERAGANTIEVDGSHVVMLSRPDAVAAVILEALNADPPADDR